MIRLYTYEYTGQRDENGLPIIRRQSQEQAQAMGAAGYVPRVRRNLRGYYIDFDDEAEAALFKLRFL